MKRVKKILWGTKKMPRNDRGKGFERTMKCESRADAGDSEPQSDAEFRLQKLVDGLRIGLAAGLFHDLPDEPAEH
jgi:hypothetical protein